MFREVISMEKSKNDSYVFGSLCYFWVLSLVFYFLKRDDKFVQFHAKQGLVLFTASFFSWIPVIGWIVGMAVFLAAVAGFIKALQGEKYRLPLVSDLAEKINF